MKYCDLHCDTALELYRCKKPFATAPLNINGEAIACFESYLQLCAYCVPQGTSDAEGFEEFFAVASHFEAEVSGIGGVVCRNKAEVSSALKCGKPAFILGMEDARITCGDCRRLEALFDAGVRIVTPLWSGETCVGGAHDTSVGLTPRGRELMHLCGELGIITDISHASMASAEEIIEIASSHGVPVTASHSCSHSLNPHTRNLSDRQAVALASTGGIVGVNSYPPHLTGGESHITDVVRHIEHFVSLLGEDRVALGMDFDGMGSCITEGLESAGKIPALRDELTRRGFTAEVCEKLLFDNAAGFLLRNIADSV